MTMYTFGFYRACTRLFYSSDIRGDRNRSDYENNRSRVRAQIISVDMMNRFNVSRASGDRVKAEIAIPRRRRWIHRDVACTRAIVTRLYDVCRNVNGP